MTTTTTTTTIISMERPNDNKDQRSIQCENSSNEQTNSNHSNSKPSKSIEMDPLRIDIFISIPYFAMRPSLQPAQCGMRCKQCQIFVRYCVLNFHNEYSHIQFFRYVVCVCLPLNNFSNDSTSQRVSFITCTL